MPVAELSGVDPATGVRVARLLGAGVLLVARRVHRLDETEPAEALGVVVDHLGFLVANPLVGPNLDELGPRFPDLTEAYDAGLRAVALEEAERAGLPLRAGVYAGHPDPNLATAAEYSMLRRLGADWVGQGGVSEVIAARHGGMRVLGLVGAEASAPRLATLVRAVLARLGGEPG